MNLVVEKAPTPQGEAVCRDITSFAVADLTLIPFTEFQAMVDQLISGSDHGFSSDVLVSQSPLALQYNTQRIVKEIDWKLNEFLKAKLLQQANAKTAVPVSASSPSLQAAPTLNDIDKQTEG